MYSPHELPPLFDIYDVQTSVLTAAIKKELDKQTEAISISTVLSDWLHLDPAKVTMDQQIRVGAIMLRLGCNRVSIEGGVLYLPPEPPPLSEPLNTNDALPLTPAEGAMVAAIIIGSIAALMAFGFFAYQINTVDTTTYAIGDWNQK